MSKDARRKVAEADGRDRAKCSGITTAINALEDLGFFCVDNSTAPSRSYSNQHKAVNASPSSPSALMHVMCKMSKYEDAS